MFILRSIPAPIDRRPIDPPPIIELIIRGTEDYAWHALQNPNYIMFVSLAMPDIEGEEDEFRELHWLQVEESVCPAPLLSISVLMLSSRIATGDLLRVIQPVLSCPLFISSKTPKMERDKAGSSSFPTLGCVRKDAID